MTATPSNASLQIVNQDEDNIAARVKARKKKIRKEKTHKKSQNTTTQNPDNTSFSEPPLRAILYILFLQFFSKFYF